MSKISIAGLAEETGLSKHAVRGRIVRDGLGPVGVDQDGRSNLYDRGAALCAVMGDERSEDACAADQLDEAEKALATVREAKSAALASLESASRTIQEREATIGRMVQQAARDQRKIELEYDARVATERDLQDWRERAKGHADEAARLAKANGALRLDLDKAGARAADSERRRTDYAHALDKARANTARAVFVATLLALALGATLTWAAL